MGAARPSLCLESRFLNKHFTFFSRLSKERGKNKTVFYDFIVKRESDGDGLHVYATSTKSTGSLKCQHCFLYPSRVYLFSPQFLSSSETLRTKPSVPVSFSAVAATTSPVARLTNRLSGSKCQY